MQPYRDIEADVRKDFPEVFEDKQESTSIVRNNLIVQYKDAWNQSFTLTDDIATNEELRYTVRCLQIKEKATRDGMLRIVRLMDNLLAANEQQQSVIQRLLNLVSETNVIH